MAWIVKGEGLTKSLKKTGAAEAGSPRVMEMNFPELREEEWEQQACLGWRAALGPTAALQETCWGGQSCCVVGTGSQVDRAGLKGQQVRRGRKGPQEGGRTGKVQTPFSLSLLLIVLGSGFDCRVKRSPSEVIILKQIWGAGDVAQQ